MPPKLVSYFERHHLGRRKRSQGPSLKAQSGTHISHRTKTSSYIQPQHEIGDLCSTATRMHTFKMYSDTLYVAIKSFIFSITTDPLCPFISCFLMAELPYSQSVMWRKCLQPKCLQQRCYCESKCPGGSLLCHFLLQLPPTSPGIPSGPRLPPPI